MTGDRNDAPPIGSGEVRLGGTVDSDVTKRLAEEAVRSVAGVSQVQNLLEVRVDNGSDLN